MELLQFWRNASAGADVSSEGHDVHTKAFGTDEEETDDEDSLFDLVFNSPDRDAINELDEASKKNFQFIESPRDVLLNKNDFSNSKPLSPVTILRSAPKFKVFMLGFKKSLKCEKIERDNSLRSKMLKERADYETSSDVVSWEKSVPKYLNLIKPFYVKVSNKADSLTPLSSPVNLFPRKFSEGRRMRSFKIGTRDLAKSRSASAVVRVAPPSIRRRDDSLLEQHDAIEGAILHCKRSYSSSSQEYSQLSRAASDPSQEKLKTSWRRNSFEEQKRCSI